LMLTMIVGIIVMYIYALIGFYRFRADFEGSCEIMGDCLTTTIYQGFRMDLGSALAAVDVTSSDWYARVGYDVSYFMIISTVLMNVIFGIIIDTFGSLRDQTQERDVYMRSFTFISSIDRQAIDKTGQAMGIANGFAYLQDIKQDKWKYLNFLFYLETKDTTEYSGVETYIAEKLADDDVMWLPILRARIMESGEEDGEADAAAQQLTELGEGIHAIKASTAELLDAWKKK